MKSRIGLRSPETGDRLLLLKGLLSFSVGSAVGPNFDSPDLESAPSLVLVHCVALTPRVVGSGGSEGWRRMVSSAGAREVLSR